MSLVKCSECQQDISDKADLCVHCGSPFSAESSVAKQKSNLWSAVTKAKTPINIFALAMMACASVLGVSARSIHDCYSLTAFTYTIHAFLAVSGMFFLAILFCRKGIYHPQELGKVKPEVLNELGKDYPIAAAALICIMMLTYGYYQFKTDFSCEQNEAEYENRLEVDLNN